MKFFLSPFIFLFELIGFLLSVAFIYGLGLILAIAFIWYGIATMPKEPEIIYVDNTVVEEVVEEESTFTCERITGCELFPNAKTDKEYCPTCTFK